MILRILIGLLIILTIFVDGNTSEIFTDCDFEFAETATKLASEHISEASIIDYIHAVTSSCNKAPIQKMAEISVFLLHKGTVTPKVMGEIKQSLDEIRKRKESDLSKKMSELPPELYSTAQKMRMISTSGALSGNERRFQIEHALSVLPASYQHQLMKLVDQQPPKMDGELIRQPNRPILITASPSSSSSTTSSPPSFVIQKEQEKEEKSISESDHFRKNFNFPSLPKNVQAVSHEKTSFQSIGKNEDQHLNVLFPDLPPTRPIEPIVKNQGGALRDLLSNPKFESLVNALMQKEHKQQQPDVSALLNPAIWSDAAKFLSTSESNDLSTVLSKFIEKKPIPQMFGTQTRQSPTIRRQNDVVNLDSYDTNINRYAISPVQVNKVDSIVGAMPTMPPSSGYATYAPAPRPILHPNVIVGARHDTNGQSRPNIIIAAEEITGSYKQPISPIYNQLQPNGQLKNVRINVVNEQ